MTSHVSTPQVNRTQPGIAPFIKSRKCFRRLLKPCLAANLVDFWLRHDNEKPSEPKEPAAADSKGQPVPKIKDSGGKRPRVTFSDEVDQSGQATPAGVESKNTNSSRSSGRLVDMPKSFAKWCPGEITDSAERMVIKQWLLRELGSPYYPSAEDAKGGPPGVSDQLQLDAQDMRAISGFLQAAVRAQRDAFPASYTRIEAAEH